MEYGVDIFDLFLGDNLGSASCSQERLGVLLLTLRCWCLSKRDVATVGLVVAWMTVRGWTSSRSPRFCRYDGPVHLARTFVNAAQLTDELVVSFVMSEGVHVSME